MSAEDAYHGPSCHSLDAMFHGGAPLLDYFLSFMTPLDIVVLSRLDRASNDGLREYFHRMFTIDEILGPFLLYVNEFREMQSRTGALISGSTALQLFNRERYVGADLDVYVDCRGALDVVNHLCGRESYHFHPKRRQDDDPSDSLAMDIMHPRPYNSYLVSGIASVLSFTRDGKKVQIIVSWISPLDVIFNFHSTCVMNVITHSTAYCLFPRMTIVGRLSRTFSGQHVGSSSTTAAQQKYIDRGFSFVASSPGDLTQGAIERWVGDRDTWMAPLSPTLVHLPADLIGLNAFQLVFDPVAGNSIDYDILDGPKLRFCYTASASERSTLCAAWDIQATKPRSTNEDGSTLLDSAFCDAMYVLRSAISKGDVVSSSLADEWDSTLHITIGGRTRRS